MNVVSNLGQTCLQIIKWLDEVRKGEIHFGSTRSDLA